MDPIYYRRAGRRYEPVPTWQSPFDPAPGVWLISDGSMTEWPTMPNHINSASPDAFTFTIPSPPRSKKNSRRWIKRGGKRFLVPSKECVADQRMIAKIASEVAASGAFLPADEATSVVLHYTHNIGDDSVRVTVIKGSPLREGRGKKGTKRDIHGMIETIADALKGIAYVDDRQIKAFSGGRAFEEDME